MENQESMEYMNELADGEPTQSSPLTGNSVRKEIDYEEFMKIYNSIQVNEDGSDTVNALVRGEVKNFNISINSDQLLPIILTANVGYHEGLNISNSPSVEDLPFTMDTVDNLIKYYIIFDTVKDFTVNPESTLLILEDFSTVSELDLQLKEKMRVYSSNFYRLKNFYISKEDLTYNESKARLEILQEYNMSYNLIYNNQLQYEKYVSTINDLDLKHLNLDNIAKLSEFKDIYVGYNNSHYKPKIVIELGQAIKNKGYTRVYVDYYFGEDLNKVIRSIAFIYGIRFFSKGKFLSEQIDYVYLEHGNLDKMLWEDKILTYHKQGLKVYNSNGYSCLALISKMTNDTTFQGAKLSEIETLVTKDIQLRNFNEEEVQNYLESGLTNFIKPVYSPEEYRNAQLDILTERYETTLPKLYSIVEEFNLTASDYIEYIKACEYVNRILHLLEINTLRGADKLLSVKDLALVEINGEKYLGFLNLSLKYYCTTFPMFAGRPTKPVQMVLTEDEVCKLIDLPLMIDYEEAIPLIVKLVQTFAKLTPEQIMKQASFRTPEINKEPYMAILMEDKEYSDELGLHWFYKELYNSKDMNSSEHLKSILVDYMSFRELRRRGHGAKVTIFGTLVRSSGQYHLFYKHLENSLNFLQKLNYIEEE